MDETDTYHPTRPRGVTAAKVDRAQELLRTMTPEERLLWAELRKLRAHGYPFRRQQVIAGFIADFYCHPARLVIEVDGAGHADQVEYDAERDTIIAAHGRRVLRVSNRDVRDHLPEVRDRIIAACAAPRPDITWLTIANAVVPEPPVTLGRPRRPRQPRERENTGRL